MYRISKRFLASMEREHKTGLLYNPKMVIPRDYSFRLEWRMTQQMGEGEDRNEEDVYINFYKGALMLCRPLGNEDQKDINEEIGCINCYLIHTHNIGNFGSNLWKTLDSVSEELSSVGYILKRLKDFEEDSSDEENVSQKSATPGIFEEPFVNDVGDGDEITIGNIAYVSEMQVNERFRGLGLGLFMLDAVVRVINGPMSLTLISPSPLQNLFPSDSNAPRNDNEIKDASQKLRTHFSRLGFADIGFPGDGLLMGRWSGDVQPRLRDVCPHLFEYRYSSDASGKQQLPMLDATATRSMPRPLSATTPVPEPTAKKAKSTKRIA